MTIAQFVEKPAFTELFAHLEAQIVNDWLAGVDAGRRETAFMAVNALHYLQATLRTIRQAVKSE